MLEFEYEAVEQTSRSNIRQDERKVVDQIEDRIGHIRYPGITD
jgi:hypothetical protein